MSNFKPVRGYEGIYEINASGQIRYVGDNQTARHYAQMEGYKRPSLDPNGYLRVTLCKGCRSTQKLLHNLLADAFLDKPEGSYLVDHIDGNRANNNLPNLRWTNQTTNQLNRHVAGAKSGVMGVHFIKGSKRNPWMATGKINQKAIYLGVYPTIEGG